MLDPLNFQLNPSQAGKAPPLESSQGTNQYLFLLPIMSRQFWPIFIPKRPYLPDRIWQKGFSSKGIKWEISSVDMLVRTRNVWKHTKAVINRLMAPDISKTYQCAFTISSKPSSLKCLIVVAKTMMFANVPWIRPIKKYLWLYSPIQLPAHGQWWSIRVTHLSQVEQWWERGGLKPLHLAQ